MKNVLMFAALALATVMPTVPAEAKKLDAELPSPVRLTDTGDHEWELRWKTPTRVEIARKGFIYRLTVKDFAWAQRTLERETGCAILASQQRNNKLVAEVECAPQEVTD